MSQSLALNLMHLIFATRERRPVLDPLWREDLYAIQVNILQQLDCPVLAIGGTDDHVHLIFMLSPTQKLADAVRHVKATSARWIQENQLVRDMRFEWQGGYAAFSVSQSNVERVKEYIQRQEEHHRRISFQDELRAILDKHELPYDERYLWD
jgi:putative transposase